MTRVPFTLAAAREQPAWRDDFRWPIAYKDLRAIQSGLTAPMLDCALGFSDERTRRTAMLSVLLAGSAIREAGFLAWHGHAAKEAGIAFVGLPDGASQISSSGVAGARFDRLITWPHLRRVARAASWQGSVFSLARAILTPDAAAVSHNDLLRDTAKRSGKSIGFKHAEVIAAAAEKDGRADAARVAAVADAFVGFLQRFPVPAHDIGALRARVRQRVALVVERADRLLDGLQNVSLPSAIWSGSAGNFPVRAVMIEARRRGSTTTVFDHGGSTAFIDEPDLLFMIDRHVADRLIMPTQKAAEMAAAAMPAEVFRGLPISRTEFSAGDPVFREAAGLAPRKPRPRPRVLYVPTYFNGGHQNLPPLLPDPVYLYHQRAVVEAFNNAPAELVLKPHPESILNGMPHPLEGLVELDERPFVEALADADVVINDYPQSTAFWEACCSDRRVVILNLGIVRFNAAARSIVEGRCAVVAARWSEENLPVFDANALVDAALSGGHCDPAAMRRVLAGPAD